MSQLKGIGVLLVLAAALIAPAVANAAPPPNDNLANAAELTGRFALVESNNVDATKETNELDHGGNSGGASVWYRWTAPADGTATVSTCGSAIDTLLAAYTGDAYPLSPVVQPSEVACEDDTSVSFNATAGTTYRIAVDGFGGVTGNVSLSLNLAPANDDFANAEELSSDTGSVTGTTIGASSEDSEADHLGLAWNSVWFEWTAPSNGWATFETCGSTFDTVLVAYAGSGVGELTKVAGNDDACDVGSRMHFQAVAGTVYRLALAGYEGETGDFTLSWNRNPPAPLLDARPRITGVVRDGEMLTASDGEWSGPDPITYSYAWERCDRDLERCGYIADANWKTFTLRSADVGLRVRVHVTASNAYGSTPSVSEFTNVVVARAPSSTLPPIVTGDAKPGAILVASGGVWSGTAPLVLTYQWQSCNAAGVNCVDVVGQTGQVMSITSEAVGLRLRVVVTAANTVGAASAPSDVTTVVRAAQARRCVVPKVRGKSLRTARAAIKRGGCRVGQIRRTFSNRVKAGRVVSQTPRAGRQLAVGARVHLTVSKGKRR